MRKSLSIKYIMIVSTLSSFCVGAEAAPFWFFGGTCDGSYVRHEAKDTEPIHCNVGILSLYQNGRALIQFNTKSGILGFAGSHLDLQAKIGNVLDVRIDTIHPETGQMIDSGVEGVCLIDSEELSLVKSIKCTVQYRNNNIGSYNIKLSVKHVDRVQMD